MINLLGRRRSSWWLAVVACAALPLRAHAAEQTKRVIAGRPEYETGGFHNLLMGSGYRKMWTTPIDFPVLDLTTYAGGLTPVRQVGSMQSVGLAMKGKDGRSYTFRSCDKDPKRILPPEWADTAPAKLFQDSTTANHPGVAFIVPALAEAAGVLHTSPKYVFMPDDPALGEFRKTFGGQPGTIEEFPLPGPKGTPGFAGAVEILSTGDLWKKFLAGEARVDDRALLRARLFDLWIEDWDRHNKQWRWLRRGKDDAFVPLPEDRDQAFSKFGGLLLQMARATHPKFMDWKDHYTNFEGWMTQGGEVDRWMLSSLGQDAFTDTAKDLVARLTDGVIEGAVKRQPPEWYALGGAELTAALVKRRDALPEAALEFYRRLSKKVDVQATDLADTVKVNRLGEDRVEISILEQGAPAPWFHRIFFGDETSEVRLYLNGGADEVVTSGPAGGPITVRVIGGGGPDRVDDSRSGDTRFYDAEGSSVVKGDGTKVDHGEWKRQPAKPAETPWLEWRDWGSRTRPAVPDLVGARPGADRGRRPHAPDLGLPQAAVLDAADRAGPVQLRPRRLQGQLRRRVPPRELEGLLRARCPGLAAREPQLLRPGQRPLERAARGPGRGLLRRRLGHLCALPLGLVGARAHAQLLRGPGSEADRHRRRARAGTRARRSRTASGSSARSASGAGSTSTRAGTG